MHRQEPRFCLVKPRQAGAASTSPAIRSAAVTDKPARARGAVGFASLRGGTVAGEHSVILAGEQERITLSHSAENRMIFARGAVKGAEWLIGKPAGRYTMPQVLGL